MSRFTIGQRVQHTPCGRPASVESDRLGYPWPGRYLIRFDHDSDNVYAAHQEWLVELVDSEQVES